MISDKGTIDEQLDKLQSDLAGSTGTSNDVQEPLETAGSDRLKSGWFSPQYTISPMVTLNPATMKANRCIALDSQAPELDAYRILRTQILQKTRETGGNTIMITSAVPGEGKTVTAINLSITLAREFQQTVLLMDCDLRNQMVHRYMGYESKGGVIDYLLNDRPMSELITWPGVEKLTVVSGGRKMTESSELLGSLRMRELVEDLRTRYPSRYVIFDMPAILDGADALAFVPLVDHVVLTVREGLTSIQDVKRSIELLPPGKLLGLVMNRHTGSLPFNQKNAPHKA
jgi:non-specific protein-tyrosine kinase